MICFSFKGLFKLCHPNGGMGWLGLEKMTMVYEKKKKAYKYVDFISLENSQHKYVNPIPYGGSDNSWVHYKRFCLSFLLA